MTLLSKRWDIPQKLPAHVNDALAHDYPPIMRQLLYNRGISTPEQAYAFLTARVPENTDPLEMMGVARAVERLQLAIQRAEPITIYGDYDADGVTATALLVQFLEGFGAQAYGYIPNRFDEGYGLNKDALAALYEQGRRLIVTVDCGIRSVEEAEMAAELGMDLIISDHHHPAGEIPRALCVINPKQPGDSYPDKDLAGVGLAYKIAAGFVASLEKQGDEVPPHLRAEEYLDLVALGAISDLVPLAGENRALVRAGLEKIRRQPRQGLYSLIIGAGLQPGNISATDVSFMLGPRLNAAGRLDSALTAFQLLITKSAAEASELAQKLEIQNRERQEITKQIQSIADAQALARGEDKRLLFAADPTFNTGVVGLAASRLTEIYYRPSIVGHIGEEFTRASCRSIPEFHITAALDQCAELLEHHGGHAAAAGFTVRNERLSELIDRLDQMAINQLGDLDLRPTLRADLEIPLRELKPDILDYLQWLQPTGQSNPQAVFVSRNLSTPRFKTVGKDNSHLKLTVSDGWITYEAIAFRQGEWATQMPARIDLMYTIEINKYNDREYLQLNVRDIQPSIQADR